MITLNLKPIFADRGIEKPYSFLIRNGFTAHAATNLVNGKVSVLSLKYMELLCESLWCEPHDLFLWQPSAERTMAPDHPLRPLSHREEVVQQNIKSMMARVPFKKLPVLSDKLTSEIKDALNPE